MDDEARRLAKAAGDGDLDAAERLVRHLRRRREPDRVVTLRLSSTEAAALGSLIDIGRMNIDQSWGRFPTIDRVHSKMEKLLRPWTYRD